MLLLRGAQTVAELRARTARLHPFATVEQVEATLQRLSEGPDALVRELPRQPGQRETRWIHLAGGIAVAFRGWHFVVLVDWRHLGGAEAMAGGAPVEVASDLYLLDAWVAM